MARFDGQEKDPPLIRAEAERHYIQVPFEERDQAKALGAKWDPDAKHWYLALGADASAFAHWPKEPLSRDDLVRAAGDRAEANKMANGINAFPMQMKTNLVETQNQIRALASRLKSIGQYLTLEGSPLGKRIANYHALNLRNAGSALACTYWDIRSQGSAANARHLLAVPAQERTDVLRANMVLIQRDLLKAVTSDMDRAISGIEGLVQREPSLALKLNPLIHDARALKADIWSQILKAGLGTDLGKRFASGLIW